MTILLTGVRNNNILTFTILTAFFGRSRIYLCNNSLEILTFAHLNGVINLAIGEFPSIFQICMSKFGSSYSGHRVMPIECNFRMQNCHAIP